MKTPSRPADETARLAALKRYEVLDTEAEEAYDELTRMAALVCEVPISLVSLVDEDRQWFKSRHGLDAAETSRAISFCGHVVASDEELVVPDATKDPRFADNPLVVGEPKIRFYAGVPLTTPQGHALGTLCAIDSKPRTIEPRQLELLRVFAKHVMTQLELRRQALEKQRALEQLGIQNRFFEHSLDMLCIATFEGYFEVLNPAWERELGFSSDELKARPFIEFVHPDDREATIAEAGALAAGAHETVAFENRYRTRAGGFKWLLWSARADHDSARIMAVARDITALKQTAASLRRAKDEADEANRVKSEFLASMSHELRTPLNSVIGFTNVLLKNKTGNLEPTQSNYLDRILANGKHLLAVISDVLDVSRIEAGRLDYRLESLDLAVVVRTALAQLDVGTDDDAVTLTADIPDGLDLILADRRRLQQVILNLVGNALKFTERGAVVVSVVADRARNAPVRLDVVDTGQGIPKAELPRVFESFHQVDRGVARKHGGTGLGLPITKALCEGMGFLLVADSVVGRGSLFSVLLEPDVPPPSWYPPRGRGKPSKPGPQRWSASSGGRPTVLVIDDDADARLVLERYLEDYGCHVVAASSASQGLEIARSLVPDLITLDLNMGGLDGFRALQVIGDEPALAEVPVVICSIAGDESRGALAGVVAVFDKPLERSQLYEVLRKYVRAGEQGRVLIVEDDPDTQVLLEEWVRSTGAVTRVESNGRRALDCLDAARPDLVVLDLCMPVMDGFGFLEALRANPDHRETPVVVCTARVLTEEERAGIDAQAVLSKGLTLESELRRVLSDHLASR